MRLRLLIVAMLVLVSTTATAFAGDSALRPTGQVDQSTPIVGELRRDLLAAGAHGPRASRPSPAHPILLRSALRVVGAKRGVRALLVSFRSVTGRSCVGVAFQGSGVAPGPFACLPPCTEPLCIAVFSGGPLPRGTRVLVGRVQPRVTELRIAGRSGPARSHRVSRSRLGQPPVAPVLLQLPSVRDVRGYAGGTEVAWVRFRR
ncbi:MAG TPA: hypothetical protein VIV36_06210 [Gaiella sp.]